MQKGKKLEKEVKDYLNKEYIFYHKFTDSYAARGFAQPVPSDYIIFDPCILLECKETQKSKLPLTTFRPSQFEAMKKCNTKVNYYVIVKYKTDYILIHGSYILQMLRKNIKSIDLLDDMIIWDTIDGPIDFMINEAKEDLL